MEQAGVKDEEQLGKAQQIFDAKEQFIANVEFKVDLFKHRY